MRNRHLHPSFLSGLVVVGAVVATQPVAAEIIPGVRRTTWSPGIPGGIPSVNTVHTTIDATVYGNGVTDATAVINNAIQAAGNTAASSGVRQAVYLPPGTYRITNSIALSRSNVVLRGASASLTRIRLDSANSDDQALRMGIFWPDYSPTVNVVGSVPKGATSITVADASGIQVGDVIQIDQHDDPSYVARGDCTWYKRGPRPEDVNGPPSNGGYRSVGQQVEVVSKNGNVLGLLDPIHIAFDAAFAPQVFKTATARSGQPGIRYTGLEDVYITGGNNNNISILNAAYCWVKNVESDGNPATGPGMDGVHIQLSHAYRCEVRGSYFHHARSINPGGGAYGISVAMQSSGNLIEDNIAYKLNKPLVMEASGGGNVVAYNYVDEAIIASNPGWQESGVDGNHCSFPHYDLFEGNWAPNIGSDTTHGNVGWQTFFRNYAPGQNTSALTDGSVRAVGIDGYSREHNIVGNLLLKPNLVVNGNQPVYDCIDNGPCMWAAAVYRVGASAMGGNYEDRDDGTAFSLLYRHGNYDSVTNSVRWDPGNPDHNLPNSLYLTSKPVFFGSLPWPWVDPTGTTRLHTLPAKARFDGGAPIPPTTTFADVPTLHWAYAYIEAVYQAGVTGGCATNPLRFCPDATVNRGQMAVFLLRAKEGGVYTPPACANPTFTDVPCSNTFAPWIYELVRRGITGGCATNPARYCPTNPVTRSQMAVLLLKTLEPAGYTPPPCANPTFTDVPCSYPTAAWIYDLVAREITSGCGGGRYCPANNNTRAQMAVFLTKTFSLPLP